MKKLAVVLVLLACVVASGLALGPSPALAQQNNTLKNADLSGNSGNQQGQQQQILGSGNSTIQKGAITNTNSQGQGQSQHQKQQQGQGQLQGQNNKQSIAPYQGVSIKEPVQDRIPAVAIAPGLTAAGTGVCLGSVSLSVAGPMAGFGFGVTKVDQGCEQRSNTALLYQMGHPAAALRVLTGESVKDALAHEGELPKQTTVAKQEINKAISEVVAQSKPESVSDGPCGPGTTLTPGGYCAWK
jgi:hypothetical protein